MFYIVFFIKRISDSLFPLFLVLGVSESLRSLTKNERMSESLVFWANCSFAHLFAKNERFAEKTDERIPSPANLRIVVLFPDQWSKAAELSSI